MKAIRNIFRCDCYLSVGGDALLDRLCMVFQRVCVVPVIPVCI